MAAAVDLDITHPPGHPVTALLSHAATLIPLGSIALRVAFMGALAGALACGFLFNAVHRTLADWGAPAPGPLALATAWGVAASPGWWFQSVRPEVYAIQAALAVGILDRLLRTAQSDPPVDPRPLYQAGLLGGFALANHHFLALLLIPAAAPVAGRLTRLRGAGTLWRSVAAVGIGLCTYVYLPARALASPPLNLGHPDTPARFFWVVSAQAFQGNTGSQVPQPMAERFADVAVHLLNDLGIAPLLALGGLYVLWRSPRSRRSALLWSLVLALFVAARAWLGFVRSNPDAQGYLQPAYAACGVGAAVLVAAIIRGLFSPARARRAMRFVGWGAAATAFVLFSASLPQVSLAMFSATDTFDRWGRNQLPVRAVLIAHGPQTVFRYWGAESQQRNRPDITLVPVPFLTYPGMATQLVAADPSLKPLVRGYLLHGALQTTDLQSLASEKPVFLELDPRVPQELFPSMVPRGLYYEGQATEAYADDRKSATDASEATIDRMEAALESEPTDPETTNQLLWVHYMRALFHTRTGEWKAAQRAVARGRAINPEAQELASLEKALNRGGNGKSLDITPFLPRRLP